MKKLGLSRSVAAIAAIGALALGLFPVSASAISRYTSTATTCSAIKAAVRNEGAIVLRWTSPRTGNLLLARAVRNRNHCLPNQTTRVTSVPASDTQSCRVNYCVERRVFDRFD